MYSNKFVIFVNNMESNILLNKLRNHLVEYNLEEASYLTEYNKYPAFIWFRHINEFNQNIQNIYYNIKCFSISRILNVDCICDKYQLYINMQKYFPDTYLDFMPKSFKLEKDTKFIPDTVFITRPVNDMITKIRCAAGRGILVYDNDKSLNDAKENLNKYDTIIASEYIKNPILFKNKKMHLRCDMFITIINGIYSCYLYDSYRIITALNEYKPSDFQDKNIHDSHWKCEDNEYLFPNDFTTENVNYTINDKIIQTIYSDIMEISKKMAIVFKKYARCPMNAKNAFHFLGFDILIDTNLKIYLMECNRFSDKTLDNKKECKFNFDRFFNWINDIILTPLFNINNINIPSFITTPVYTAKYINN